jgi:hypothetical protein
VPHVWNWVEVGWKQLPAVGPLEARVRVLEAKEVVKDTTEADCVPGQPTDFEPEATLQTAGLP